MRSPPVFAHFHPLFAFSPPSSYLLCFQPFPQSATLDLVRRVDGAFFMRYGPRVGQYVLNYVHQSRLYTELITVMADSHGTVGLNWFRASQLGHFSSLKDLIVSGVQPTPLLRCQLLLPELWGLKEVKLRIRTSKLDEQMSAFLCFSFISSRSLFLTIPLCCRHPCILRMLKKRSWSDAIPSLCSCWFSLWPLAHPSNPKRQRRRLSLLPPPQPQHRYQSRF